MKREKRIRMQEMDPGGPDDTVYRLPRHWDNSGGSQSVGKHYHESKHCATIQETNASVVEISRQNAKQKWLAPCKRCVPLSEYYSPPDPDKYDDELLNELSDSE